jgi:Asp-tRNA(Asn)/Glu-tRNA(Gln) amidotransferase A subunit family amidase
MLKELAANLRSGVDTAVAAVERALTAAERGETGAFVETLAEDARKAAAAADSELSEGVDRGPLHGIPVAIKDNMDVAGAWTRCGTAGLGHHRAERDAAAVARLREAGAVIVGKTRTHELTWGMITHGCRNPRDPSRITGGSSGGSAAAVAEGAVPAALGTDTGGSVRNPAALCGVVGAKTALGALPMDGVAPMAPTQDTVGVFGNTVRDCEILLQELGISTPRQDIRVVGRIRDRWAQRVQPEVSAALDEAADQLRSSGVEIVDVTVPHSELAPSVSYVIMLAEAARSWFPPSGAVGDEVRQLLQLGANVREADYTRALQVRAAVRAGVDEVLTGVDALLVASAPAVAPPIGASTVDCAGRTVPVTTALSGMTALASVAGLPAVSVPGPSAGLPVGVQFVSATIGTVLGCAERIAGGISTGRVPAGPSTEWTNP